jgi:hypothetical protein
MTGKRLPQKRTQHSKHSSGQHTLVKCWQCNYATWRVKWGTLTKNQNMYNLFGDNDDNTATDNKPKKLTTGSSITGGHMAATIQDSVIQAINQLSTNQHMLINQIAAMSFNNASAPPQQYTTPPISQVNIPAHATNAGANAGEFNAGRGGHGRTGTGHGSGREGGRHQCTPFANHMRKQTQQEGRGRGCGNGSFVPGRGMVAPPAQRAYQSNLVKNFTNWNVCYSCCIHHMPHSVVQTQPPRRIHAG